MTCSKGRRPTVDRPPSRSPRECPAGVEPACPVCKTGASTARPRAHFNLRWSGRRGSRTPKAHRSPVFETGAVARRLALPSGSTEGRNRTSVSTVNNRPPVPALAPSVSIGQSGRPDLNRRSPGPRPGGLPSFPTPREVPSGSRTRTSAMARRQAAATSWARITET
jgi:hypothetical protein